MKAFHNDPSIKDKYLERLRKHAAADEIIQGVGWINGKGCAVGCTLNSYIHTAYETELGIPTILAKLEDRIFELLSPSDAKDFPINFLHSINVGADLSKVLFKFMHWMLVDPVHGVHNFAKTERVKNIITDVGILYWKKTLSENILTEEWEKLCTAVHADYSAAAYSAAASAHAHASAAATDAIYDAAHAVYAAAYAYSYAAYVAYVADAHDANAYCYADYVVDGKQKYAKIMADKLCEILKETK